MIASNPTRHRNGFQDLAGQVFGALTVIRFERSKSGRSAWICQCACGSEKKIDANNLKAGRSKSCGNARCQTRKLKEIRDLTGLIFTRLTVIELHKRTGRCGPVWRCMCECGKERFVPSRKLESGHSKSCGCYSRDKAKERATTHGFTAGEKNSQVYVKWNDMVRRCNPNTVNEHRRKNYVEKGITVCERWMKFENFLKDMGEPPTPKHEIDRADNTGNYEPGNCRWATRKEQMRNFSKNVMLTCRGQTHCVAEWSEISGVPAYRISTRIKYGWSHERAVFTPPKEVGFGSPKRRRRPD